MEHKLKLYLIISIGVLLITIIIVSAIIINRKKFIEKTVSEIEQTVSTIIINRIINRKKFIEQRDENFRSEGITPETFFQMRRERVEQKLDDISGVYIIYNVTKNMYYVGQTTRLYFRLNQHFTGHGNGDVYADYKYGDKFLIHHIPLNGSGYSSLDALERAKIAEYDAYNNGYNRTQGNH